MKGFGIVQNGTVQNQNWNKKWSLQKYSFYTQNLHYGHEQNLSQNLAILHERYETKGFL